MTRSEATDARRRQCVLIAAAAILLPFLAALPGCVTGGGSESAAAEAPAAPQDENAGSGIGLGPLEDEDLRRGVYDDLAAQIATSVGGDSTSIELGDYSAFKFTVTRLMRGAEDITGAAGGAAADGMDIEVTGWFKRTLSQGEEDPQDECRSFETLVTVVRTPEGAWNVARDRPFMMERQDLEDCY